MARCGAPVHFPSPLGGEGGEHEAKRNASRVRGQVTLGPPHPARYRVPTSPHRGVVKEGA